MGSHFYEKMRKSEPTPNTSLSLPCGVAELDTGDIVGNRFRLDDKVMIFVPADILLEMLLHLFNTIPVNAVEETRLVVDLAAFAARGRQRH